MFGRANITMGIGPHSSILFYATDEAHHPPCYSDIQPLSQQMDIAAAGRPHPALIFMAALRSRCGHYIFTL